MEQVRELTPQEVAALRKREAGHPEQALERAVAAAQETEDPGVDAVVRAAQEAGENEAEAAAAPDAGNETAEVAEAPRRERKAPKTTKRIRKKRRPARVAPDDIITLDNVTKTYSVGAPALNGVTLHIKKGEFVFIIGDSGSGKTTLIKLLLRELVPTSGTITVMGQNVGRIRHSRIPKFRRKLGIVFQDFRLLPDRNVYENVAFAQRVVQTPAREIKGNVTSMLAMVGLAPKYKYKVEQLSGGEQQRVAIARALVNRPDILLADEPTGNLDADNSWEIMRLMEQINESGTTVLVVTHNKEIVNKMQKRVITMRKGVVVADQEKGTYSDED